MKKTTSQFQPGHDGKHSQVPVTPGMSHMSHGGADSDGFHAPGNVARDSTVGKLNRATPIHGGMIRQVAGKTVLGGGHVASTIESGGQIIPASKNAATPSWGNAGLREGNPMQHTPAGKNLAPVKTSWNQKSQSASSTPHSELGEAILREAFNASDAATRQAHGRK